MFYFHPYLRKIPILTNIFQMGWNHQPVLLSPMILGIHVKIPGCINCIYTPSQQKKPNVTQNTGDFFCVFSNGKKGRMLVTTRMTVDIF